MRLVRLKRLFRLTRLIRRMRLVRLKRLFRLTRLIRCMRLVRLKILICLKWLTGSMPQQIRHHRWHSFLLHLQAPHNVHLARRKPWRNLINLFFTTRRRLLTPITTSCSLIEAIRNNPPTQCMAILDRAALKPLLKVTRFSFPDSGIPTQHLLPLLTSLPPAPSMRFGIKRPFAHQSTSIRDQLQRDVPLTCHLTVVLLCFLTRRTQCSTAILTVTQHPHLRKLPHHHVQLVDMTSPYLLKPRSKASKTLSNNGKCAKHIRREMLRKLAAIRSPLHALFLLSRHTPTNAFHQHQQRSAPASMSALLSLLR
jgi:hypothetical protein